MNQPDADLLEACPSRAAPRAFAHAADGLTNWRTAKRIALGLALVATGCAHINTQRSVEDIPQSVQKQKTLLPNSSRLVVKASASGADLVLWLSRDEQCNIVETPIVRRVVHEQRNQTPPVAWYEYGGAVVFTGLGVYSIADAQGLANLSQNMSSGSTSGASPVTFQVLGAAFAAIGATFLTFGIVDSLRATDRTLDEGLVPLPGLATEGNCNPETVANAQVRITLRSGTVLSGRTGADGATRVPLGDVAAGDVPDSSGSAAVGVGALVARISLDDASRQGVIQTLLADDSTRAAKEAAAALKGACAAALKAARTLKLGTDSDVATENAAKTSWTQARTACGPSWTPDDQAQESEVLAAIKGIEADRPEREAAQGREHVKRAWELLRRKDKLVAVKAEREKASALGADVGKLDVAIQARESQDLLQTWKVFANRCARLRNDKAAIDRVQNCAASCQKIQAKVDSAWEELEHADLPPSPGATASSKVKALCERAGCPTCPE